MVRGGNRAGHCCAEVSDRDHRGIEYTIAWDEGDINLKEEPIWIGKGQESSVELLNLLHDATKDYGDPAAYNMLIYGDNLLALKALD